MKLTFLAPAAALAMIAAPVLAAQNSDTTMMSKTTKAKPAKHAHAKKMTAKTKTAAKAK